MRPACISTQLADLNGYVYFNHTIVGNSDTKTFTRRVARAGTLDGGAYLNDAGFSHGDRTMKITAQVDEATFNQLAYIIENHSLIWLSLDDGAYTGALEKITASGGSATIRVLVTGKA